MLKILTASDLLLQVQALYTTGMQRGYKTGWPEIDQFYSIRPGYWTVVTGIPSHGKSTWLDNLMLNLIDQGWYFVIYSPENMPHEIHVASLIEKYVGASFKQSDKERVTPTDLARAMSHIDKHIRFLGMDEDSPGLPNMNEVLLAADEAMQDIPEKVPVGVIVDPYNELDHSRLIGMTETEYISYELATWRQFHRTRKTHGWLVAHPAKLQRDKKSGKYPIPTLYDINGSAHWFNKCDNGIVVWRDESAPGTVEIHVKKVRFKHDGKPGLAMLDYDARTGMYHDNHGNQAYKRVGEGTYVSYRVGDGD